MGLFDRSSQVVMSWNNSPRHRPPFEGAYIYILALLTGYLLADLGALSLRPSMLPTQPPPSRPVSAPRQQFSNIGQYQKIKDRNIFNADGKIPPALTTDGNDSPDLDAPPVASQLPLKLDGTLVHINPRKSVATISSKNKGEGRAYMVDQEIENMARVYKIERRRVVFRNLNTQRLEFIEIPKDSSVTFGVKNPTLSGEEVQRRGDFDFTMRRGDLKKYTADLGSILQKARVVPNVVPGTGGRVDGFKFVAIEPGSIFEKLGFKVDDVIKGVNGEPVNSPTKAMELYNALQSDGHIRMTVERGGREETFSYDVNE